MERRTVTMNWDHLEDFNVEDDIDEFFESTNRLSVVVPLDMPLPEDDDDPQFNDGRVSFSNNLASNSIKRPQLSTAQYDMWMVAPGSISDRRRKLLQGMGLNSKKDFARLPSTNTTILNEEAHTKRLPSTKVVVIPTDAIISNEKPNDDTLVKESSPPLEESRQAEPELQSDDKAKAQPHAKAEPQPHPEQQPQPEPEPEPEPQPQLQVHVQDQAQALALSQPMLLVRSRSDSDIETSSFNTKRRKEDMIGSISKQSLTRTSSELVTPSVGLSCQYANVLRVYTTSTKSSLTTSTTNNKKNDMHTTSSAQVDSFFLIKNLDTGKEFVVKEFNDDGMWNKVSDLQTGKQLTMDEFENTVGHSPVVKELMRRTSRKRNGMMAMTNSYLSKSFRSSKKKGAAFLKHLKGSMISGSKTDKEKLSGSKTEKEKMSGSKTEKEKISRSKTEKEKEENVTTTTTTTATTTTVTTSSLSSQSSRQHKTSVERVTSNDKNSSSEWVKAKAYGKPSKEFSALHLCQKIEAHDGSIWTMRFSFDGHYLASGGEDKVIHVWEVQECDVHSMRSGDDKGGSITPDNRPPLPENSTTDKKKKSKNHKRKTEVPEYVKVPESMFGLSEKPLCTFSGHQDDVLDLSWSRSQFLLSSSMDKTVRLWDIETKNCLKQFAHSDYVTCIQFNPTDDDYFISGSLDKKVRIWNIPSRKVVDWSDLHDMITSICYYPDGQGAIVGLHNGNCKSYSTADCKLELKDQIELHTKAKADPKKITSFQFSPSNPSEVVITSADSRIRIIEGLHVVEKLIGYKNTSSQFTAQYTADGKYVICASEDSQVYIWKHEKPKHSGGTKPKYVTTTSYEHFTCMEVTVAVPWHGSNKSQGLDNEPQAKCNSKRSGPLSVDDNAQAKKSSHLPPVPKKGTEKGTNEDSEQPSNTDTDVGESDDGSLLLGIGAAAATPNNNIQSTAWGLVIVTAGLGGEIRVYQNVGLPVKVGNLF
ncbi:putative transcription factor WD40-like family [Helianthus annuus]|uniref:Transcription factor WD40-like family n=2 Tax=Helianthus annuus TaxID=4232 RepID=A0A9K3JU71_HELAN|nr:putative transcription factor WD40-like family [Helianthus annuus]KAJ0610830.1 putative transcription factor WD40-like family [Helianthus annuus]KAJ0782422.1 putative transcription factor WD40-like family [Helianthus annuus]KAJ0956031.1 putative transcription factor WD40-like family [Helianthus annuus]